jgi:hypothetical protein
MWPMVSKAPGISLPSGSSLYPPAGPAQSTCISGTLTEDSALELWQALLAKAVHFIPVIRCTCALMAVACLVAVLYAGCWANRSIRINKKFARHWAMC